MKKLNKYTITKCDSLDNNKNVLVVKKSKFISKLYSITSKEEAEEIIKKIREEYKEAKHVVYAYTLKVSGKFSDDKEPQGTAGKPIYSLLEKENLVNVLIIVVRYFGGVLLGTGLLTRAYLEAAKQILSNYEKEEYVEYVFAEIEVNYAGEEKVKKQVLEINGEIIKIERDGKVRISVNIPSNKIDILSKYIG